MNPNVVVSVSLLVLGAFVTIFLWMNANGLSTDDISLSDACWESMNTEAIGSDDNGDDVLLCDAIDQNSLTWDSIFACDNSGDGAGYSFKALFEAFSDDYNDCAAAADAVDDEDAESGDLNCGGKFAALVEDSCSADRRHLSIEANQQRGLGDNTFWPGFAYGPCSMGIGFIVGLSEDDAECSGLRGFHGGAPGCKKRYPRGRQWWLWDGCYNHDYCLVGANLASNSFCGAQCTGCENAGINYGWSFRSGPGYNCDDGLASQAKKCATEWHWKSCGWGCKYPATKCTQSVVAAAATWGIMGNAKPQKSWCASRFP